MARRQRDAHGQGPTQRQLRVGELVRHALAEVLTRGELHSPDLAGVFVTVTEVRTSPDLRHATAFIAPLGGGDPAPVIAALGRAKNFLRGRVAKSVNLKYAPELHFQPDTSFDYAERMRLVMQNPKVVADLEKPDTEDDAPGEEA